MGVWDSQSRHFLKNSGIGRPTVPKHCLGLKVLCLTWKYTNLGPSYNQLESISQLDQL